MRPSRNCEALERVDELVVLADHAREGAPRRDPLLRRRLLLGAGAPTSASARKTPRPLPRRHPHRPFLAARAGRSGPSRADEPDSERLATQVLTVDRRSLLASNKLVANRAGNSFACLSGSQAISPHFTRQRLRRRRMRERAFSSAPRPGEAGGARRHHPQSIILPALLGGATILILYARRALDKVVCRLPPDANTGFDVLPPGLQVTRPSCFRRLAANCAAWACSTATPTAGETPLGRALGQQLSASVCRQRSSSAAAAAGQFQGTRQRRAVADTDLLNQGEHAPWRRSPTSASAERHRVQQLDGLDAASRLVKPHRCGWTASPTKRPDAPRTGSAPGSTREHVLAARSPDEPVRQYVAKRDLPLGYRSPDRILAFAKI